MDEEKGVRKQRRALIASSSSRDDMTSLAARAEKVSFSENDDDEKFEDEDDDGSERTGFIYTKKPNKNTGSLLRNKIIALKRSFPTSGSSSSSTSTSYKYLTHILHKTLLPDTGLSFRGYPLVEGSGFTIKLLKFVCLTFITVAIVHVIVGQLFEDRDRVLKLQHIWVFEGDLMVRDCFVFFVVGRLWDDKRQGIDHLAWMGTAILANVYFESQNFVWFLQHSVTLFQMHCIWPWELWLFALVLIASAGMLIFAHVVKAWREKIILIKLTEMGLCILFFVSPMITSNYFHMHHWYAGWLMGMHFNYDVWWSRLAMAWCWGMYVNGIAVYGRDPVLTCEYSYFLTLDNRCPYISCYLEGLADMNNTNITEMVPVDWRNCSATDDYHP